MSRLEFKLKIGKKSEKPYFQMPKFSKKMIEEMKKTWTDNHPAFVTPINTPPELVTPIPTPFRQQILQEPQPNIHQEELRRRRVEERMMAIDIIPLAAPYTTA